MGDKPLKTFSGGETPIERILREALPVASDRFHVERTLASGSTGTIEVVFDRALRRRLARKVQHRALRLDRRALCAFIREAQITAQLDHPSIVPVYDFGQIGEQLFFTMKWIDGVSLDRRVAALPKGPLGEADHAALARVVRKLCNIVGFAHARGWIHCDVKPQNVMLDDLDRVFLMDWGVARRHRTGEENPPLDISIDGAFEAVGDHGAVGTPGFMSPEQTRNDGVLDPRTDLFMVGTVLYFLLARRPPFEAPTVSGILRLADLCEYPPLAKVAPKTPPALVRIVEKAMATDPEARYQSAAAMADDLASARP